LSPDDYETYIGTYNYYGVDDSGAPFDMSQDVLNKHIIVTGLIQPVKFQPLANTSGLGKLIDLMSDPKKSPVCNSFFLQFYIYYTKKNLP